MPPRYAYWTIVVGDQPTAFRAGALDEIMPTFNRLKQKDPSAVLMWFQNGKLWNSRLEAREAMYVRGEVGRKRDPRQQGRERPTSDARPAWSPRAPARPAWSPKPEAAGRKPWAAKPDAAAGRKPWATKPDTAGRKPWSGKPSSSDRPAWKPKTARPQDPKTSAKPAWSPKPSAKPAWSPKPSAKLEWQPKTARPQDRKTSAKPAWSPKPQAAGRKPWTAKPSGASRPKWEPKGKGPAPGARPEWKPKASEAPSRPEAPRPRAARVKPKPGSKNWRPGGTHEDPRQKYKDAKKAKWTRFKKNIRERSAGRKKS